MWKCSAVLGVGLMIVGSASLEKPADLVQNRDRADNFGPFCVLLAEPINHFTRIDAPAALTDGRIRPNAIPIEVTYGSGFSSYPQAQAAFQHAVNIWKTQLDSPVAVTVQADFSNLGPSVLGYAFYNSIARNFTGAFQADTWFPGPITNALAGSVITGNPAISTTFSNAINWYFGTDGLPAAGQYDFVSVVLHELGHGLGFAGSTRLTSGLGAWGSGSPASPYIYDRYLANGSNQALTNTGLFPNNSAALAAQLTGNNVFWAGGEGVAGNGGSRPRLYAPPTWLAGSSIAHLDDASYAAGTANSLMTHQLGGAEAIHDPGPITRGMLKDSGLTIASGCRYALSAPAFTIGQPGGAGTVGVTTNSACAWTAASTSPFITITANATATGTAIVGYSVPANAGSARTGTLTIAGQAFTLTQSGTGTTMSVNRAALAFGAINTGALSNISASQAVTVTFASGSPTWTATTSTPWLQVAGGSAGNGQFTVSVINAPGLPVVGTATGSVTVTSGGAGNSPVAIPVRLTLFPSTTSSAPPFGAFDTPATGANVAGSIAVTGWALDDIEVARIELWRDRVAGETTPVYGGGGPGNGKIYVADPTFISGARPDVETGYATMPFAYRAGWGYLLLTQGLWNQGNGSFTLYAFAFDRDGHSTTLGTKTITGNNATATTPFGAIDTPGNGQTVTGSFWNFGWALTPNANPTCTIGTVQVSIDSGPLQPVSYGDLRSDIASGFPGFSNSLGAGGAYYIDTSALSNGTHQIGWYVVDNCNRAEGIGSRFFTVLNGASAAGAGPAKAGRHITSTPRTLDAPVEVRRGLDSTFVQPAVSGDRIVPIAQDERVELILPASARGRYTARQMVDGEGRALPLGSSFDAATGTFYWQPSAAFLGRYQLEFAGADGVIAVSAVVGTAVRAAIDTPRPGAVSSSFVIAGWAVDLAAQHGTGIDMVHAWAYPQGGGPPVFLGAATLGGTRPDIAALQGEQFAGASFTLTTPSLAPGTYNIVIYPHTSVVGDFRGAQVVRVRVE